MEFYSKMSYILKFVNFLIIFVILIVDSLPTCEYKNSYNKLEVFCTNNNGTGYVLERGLVSDNNATSISLQHLKITDVDFESFENLDSLKHLDLSNNQISNLKLGVLDGFKQLTHLNLSNNFLSAIELGLFDQKPNLEVLDLSSNRIGQLVLGVFDPLKKLRHIVLANNNLLGKDLNPYIFDQSSQITYIDLSNNDMNDSPDNLFNAFEVLENLYLKHCHLKNVPTFATRKNIATLKTFVLSGNLISKLDSSMIFTNLVNLEKLDLSNNYIELLHDDIFQPLKKLKMVVLRGNKVTHLPESLFRDMKSLLSIDLSRNMIETVPVNAFRGAPLKYLNLSNNRFTYLTDNFCLELKNSGGKLTKFYFNHNPWQCSCLLQTLKEVKSFNIVYNSLHYDGTHPVCVTDAERFCKRQDSFNSVYTDLYDDIVLNKILN